jgi:hypothetical protein
MLTASNAHDHANVRLEELKPSKAVRTMGKKGYRKFRRRNEKWQEKKHMPCCTLSRCLWDKYRRARLIQLWKD